MQLSNGVKFGRFKDGREKKTSEKTLFRQSPKWRYFRQQMIFVHDATCELCQMQYAGAREKLLQAHHLKPEDYQNLDPKDFTLLCASCHDLVERFITRINGGYFNPPENFSLWMRLLLPHISWPARQKVEEILAGTYTVPQKLKMAKPKEVRK